MAHYVITGASSGIGAALALELGRRGHAVGLVARRQDKLAEVAAAVRDAGGTAAVGVADVTDRVALQAAVDAMVAAHGPVDCMVANAGGGSGPTTASQVDAETIAHQMRLNFEGAVNAMAAVLPAMVARGRGHIAAVSSLSAFVVTPPANAYSASKVALTFLMEGWAIELRGTGVAVTTIHPGFVRTPFTDGNDFAMPFIIPVEKAARIMADGLERRRRFIEFPWPLALAAKLGRYLPWWIFEPAARWFIPDPETMKKA